MFSKIVLLLFIFISVLNLVNTQGVETTTVSNDQTTTMSSNPITTKPNGQITEDLNTLMGIGIAALIFSICACLIICSGCIWWSSKKGYFKEVMTESY